MNKKLIYILIVIILIGIVFWLAFFRNQSTLVVNVASFEECVKAGYPVMESHPRQCRTPDGRTYAEELPTPPITYNNTSKEFITVETPTPGAVTGKEFKIIGKARGFMFEASFPIEVLDKNGNKILETHAEAKSDWMVDTLVPFEADIKLPDSYIGAATLVLHKDNPSGLPEHDASISFPITVEY
jgi:hypothetical protein